jgi:Skp family chaperone for outer membrane proteins
MRHWVSFAIGATLTLVSAGVFAQAQTKIAVLDTMKVANESKEGKKIQAALKDYHDKKQAEISAKESDLKALEDKSKDPKISDTAKDELRNQFTQKMYEYQAFAKAAQDEMENRSQKMQNDFQGKLAGVIAKYAQAKAISVVVEKGICLFNADSLEVTTDIIAEMNKSYPGT